jgi:hypothetical protein
MRELHIHTHYPVWILEGKVNVRELLDLPHNEVKMWNRYNFIEHVHESVLHCAVTLKCVVHVSLGTASRSALWRGGCEKFIFLFAGVMNEH